MYRRRSGGSNGLQAPDISGSSDSLIQNVLSGFRLRPGKGAVSSESASIAAASFAYNTDQRSVAKPAAVFSPFQMGGMPLVPNPVCADFAGLTGVVLVPAKLDGIRVAKRANGVT